MICGGLTNATQSKLTHITATNTDAPGINLIFPTTPEVLGMLSSPFYKSKDRGPTTVGESAQSCTDSKWCPGWEPGHLDLEPLLFAAVPCSLPKTSMSSTYSMPGSF